MTEAEKNQMLVDVEAATKATREFLRLTRLRELKAASGKVEFDANWQRLEELELHECGYAP